MTFPYWEAIDGVNISEGCKMELGTYTPRPAASGDHYPAQDNVSKPLIVRVREHRSGIKTKYNSDPNKSGYKPEGGEGVVVDLVELATGEYKVGALWMNPAVVDNLAPRLGEFLPITLEWQASQKGGSSYLAPVALDGEWLAYAQQWAAANGSAFEATVQQRMAEQAANAGEQAPAGPPSPPALPSMPVPGAQAAPAAPAPATPPVPAAPVAPAVPAAPQPPAAPVAPAAPAQAAAPAVPPVVGGVELTPETLALLAQIQQQQNGQ